MKFFMTQRVDETLEDYVERFQFSYKHATNCKLDDESLKLVLLRGVREDLMEALDLIVAGDIYQFTYDEIKYIFKNYSRETMRKGRGSKIISPSTSKNTTRVTKAEIGNLIEDMKKTF
jgi:hypothetical protein